MSKFDPLEFPNQRVSLFWRLVPILILELLLELYGLSFLIFFHTDALFPLDINRANVDHFIHDEISLNLDDIRKLLQILIIEY